MISLELQILRRMATKVKGHFIASYEGHMLPKWRVPVDVNLGYLAEIVFVMFLHSKVTLPASPIQHYTLWRKLLSKAHIKGQKVRLWLLECRVFLSTIWNSLPYLSSLIHLYIYLIITLYRLMHIYLILLSIIQYHIIFCMDFSSFDHWEPFNLTPVFNHHCNIFKKPFSFIMVYSQLTMFW